MHKICDRNAMQHAVVWLLKNWLAFIPGSGDLSNID